MTLPLPQAPTGESSEAIRPVDRVPPSGPVAVPARGGEVSDAELIVRILRKDRFAAGEFFRRFRPHVTSVLYRVMGGDSEVNDLVQETFLRALRNIENLRSPSALRAWLTRVATYTALDHLRRRRRRGWLEFVPPEQLETSLSPEASAVMPRVQAIMELLPPEERVALSLRYMVGLEQKELAEALECSVATAKRRVNKARERFESLAARDEVLESRMEELDG